MPLGYELSPDYGRPPPTPESIVLGAIVFVTLLLVMLVIVRGESPIVGSARVHDGDSLKVGGTKIRLEGIDAPEIEPICLASSAQPWNCGITARDKHKAKVGMATVNCEPDGKNQHGRTLATCYLKNEELGAWLVREGWALCALPGSLTGRGE